VVCFTREWAAFQSSSETMCRLSSFRIFHSLSGCSTRIGFSRSSSHARWILLVMISAL